MSAVYHTSYTHTPFTTYQYTLSYHGPHHTPQNPINTPRYGQYCGPGPDDSQWNVIKPVDALDVVCQNHDKNYKSCLMSLSHDTGYQIPKLIHQIMAMRGFIAPTFILHWAFRVAPRYMSCMHEADRNLVVAFERVLKYDLFPQWWSNPALAPAGTQGATGYQEACALGVKGKCAVSSRMLFGVMLSMFQKSVERDTRVAPQAFFTSTPPPPRHHVPSTSTTTVKKTVTTTMAAKKQNQTTVTTMEALYLF